jgi:ABC-type sugar transport system permease subunit
MSEPATAAKAKVLDPAKKRGAIRDQGYKPYKGKYVTSGRWSLIAERMLKMSAKQPWVIVSLILCIFPGLVAAVITYIQSKLYAAVPNAPAPDPNVYWVMFKPYGALLLAFLTALFAGGGAVADDARGGAFQFYFARPITRDQYLVGKLIPPVILTLVVIAGPALPVALLRVALARDGAAAMLVPLWTVVLGVIAALVMGVPVVALSSLSKGRGYVQGAYATLFLLPWILGAIFAGVIRSPWPAIFSIPHHLQNVARFLFQIDPGDERTMPVAVSAAVLAALVAGSLALLRRRLESVEVIAG